MSVPVFITTHNRVRSLRLLVDWLERAGHNRITFVDNASTYESLLEFFTQVPYKVIRLGENLGAHAVWEAGLVPDEPFVVTDPDIVPIEKCPLDAVQRFSDLLEKHPTYTKCGFGLYLSDVPHRCSQLGHEKALQAKTLSPGCYDSAIDTTFALYRAGAEFESRAIRTSFPYSARHLCPSWYGGPFDEEDRFYLQNARKDQEGSTWARTTVLG